MENGELTQWVNFSNQLQTRTRRGDQWSPTNRYDVALHWRPLAAPTVRQYAVRITQRKMPDSTFIFHSQFSITAQKRLETYVSSLLGLAFSPELR